MPTLAGAFFTQMVAGFGFIAFSLLAPSLAGITGLNERDFGLAITFIFIGTAISSPLTGALVRRFGGVYTVAFALLFMAATYLIVLAGSWPATMLAALLFGIGYGPQGPVGMTVVTERTPPARRGLFLALRHSSQPFAAAIAGRVLPPLMVVAGWQAGVWTTIGALLAGALFTLMVPSLFRLENPPAPQKTRSGIGGRRWLAAAFDTFTVPRGLGLLWGAGLVFAINQIAMIVFAYLYLLEVAGLTPIAAGIFVSNMQFAGLFGRPLLGWFCDRTGQSQWVLAGLAVIGVFTIIALLQFASKDMPAWTLFAISIACGLSGQTWNSVFTTAMSYQVAPERLAEMNGKAFSFLSLGWMAGAPFFWILIELSGGYDLPFGIILVANLAVAVILVATARPKPERSR